MSKSEYAIVKFTAEYREHTVRRWTFREFWYAFEGRPIGGPGEDVVEVFTSLHSARASLNRYKNFISGGPSRRFDHYITVTGYAIAVREDGRFLKELGLEYEEKFVDKREYPRIIHLDMTSTCDHFWNVIRTCTAAQQKYLSFEEVLKLFEDELEDMGYYPVYRDDWDLNPTDEAGYKALREAMRTVDDTIRIAYRGGR